MAEVKNAAADGDSADGSARAQPEDRAFRLAAEGPQDVELYVHRWEPPTAPKACVLIAHGMAEHVGRYDRLAGVLTAAGYAVYGHDQRGHGKTAQVPGDFGYFADEHGFRCLVDDLYRVKLRVAGEHPGLPIFLLGHSMGATVAQHYLFTHGDALAGAVLSATGGGRKGRSLLGLAVTAAERLRLGPRGKSKFVQLTTFDTFNLQFRPTRTDFDWLSSDADEVDRYVDDPLCGFALTVQGWHDVFGGILEAEKLQNMRRMPDRLPVFFVSGALDPVGDRGRGTRRLIADFKRAGMRDVESKLYPGMRHEIFNELDREQVHRDLVAWLDGALARAS